MDPPDSHRQVLEALARWPPDTGTIDPEVLEELRRWGMVMPKSLELTAMGSRYARGAKGGVLESRRGWSSAYRAENPNIEPGPDTG